MDLVSLFPSASSSGGGGNIPGPVTFGVQSFTLNGATQNVSATGGAIVEVSGSTVGSTIQLPTATGNVGLTFLLANPATVNYTLSSAGGNIDGAATRTMLPGMAVVLSSDGTNWVSDSLASWVYNTFNVALFYGIQTFATSGTVSATGGPVVTFTGGAAQTVTLPLTPTTGMALWIRNESASAVTLGGNGVNIDGSVSQSLTAIYGVTLIYDGTQWRSLGTSPWLALNVSSTVTLTGTTAASGPLDTKELTFTRQAAAGSFSPTITGGNIWAITGTAGATITAPSTPRSGIFIIVRDEGGNAATNNITVSGNGNTIDGNATKVISTNGGHFQMYWSGTAWFTCA